jgi:hypothetical protein
LKQLIAEAASGGASDAASEEPADGAESEAPTASQDAALVAAGRMAMTLTGADSAGQALEMLGKAFAASRQLAEREEQLAADRAALEGDERRGLVVQLIKLGAETPATAWTGDDAKTICKRLSDEPIAEMRVRVKALSTKAPRRPTVKPPVIAPKTFDGVELSARELALCAETGAKPEEYARNKRAWQAAREKVKAV